MRDSFLDSPPSEFNLMLEFTDKEELKVWRKPVKLGDNPLLVFSMCHYKGFKKDAYLCLALKNENSSPRTENITLFRNLLNSLNAKKIKYEIW